MSAGLLVTLPTLCVIQCRWPKTVGRHLYTLLWAGCRHWYKQCFE